MIYYKVGGIIFAGICLLIIAFIWFRKLFWGLLIIEVICSGFLSFYIFYYIGSYCTTPEDIVLNQTVTQIDGGYHSLKIDLAWSRIPCIFGFNGGNDILVVRYNPGSVDVVSADTGFMETGSGESTVKLPKEYKYSIIEQNEKEIYFNIKDGKNFSTQIILKGSGDGGSVKVFFLHDHKKPLESQEFWEKGVSVQF
jgi:hypothetical protein